MNAIQNFLKEMSRSDWHHNVPYQQRKYNGVTVLESEQSYYNTIVPLYSAAVFELMEIPTDKYGILQKLVEEVEECQRYFEIPSNELLQSLLSDYENSNHQIRGLREDYDYLCFVKACMEAQIYFLDCFKKKLPSKIEKNLLDKSEPKGNIGVKENNHVETIKGVNGLANFLKIGTTKAQDILNSEVLQKNGIAYRVGKVWNIDQTKLTEILSKNPTLLYKRNKTT